MEVIQQTQTGAQQGAEAGEILFLVDCCLKNEINRLAGINALMSGFLKELSQTEVITRGEELIKDEFLGVREALTALMTQAQDGLTSISNGIKSAIALQSLAQSEA